MADQTRITSASEFLAEYNRDGPDGELWRFRHVAEDVWRELLAAGFSPEVVLLSKTIPVAILQILSAHDDDRIRRMVAERRAAAPILNRLAADRSAAVRLSVAWNPKVSREVLELLESDPEPRVREIVADRMKKMGG